MTDQMAFSAEQQLKPGDMVALRGDASITGVITEVFRGVPEERYRVFLGGDKGSQIFYASQLELRLAEETPPTGMTLPLIDFQARLTALQLTEPSLSNLYSLHAARVNYVPYQFRPVLKFIKSDRPRLLIADEVGVGKTIEAGLILRELQARQDVNTVLIICPKPLVTERKWQNEMKRFDEQFEHLDGETLRHCIKQTDLDGEWPSRFSKAIMPLSLFDDRMLNGRGDKKDRNREIGLVNLDPPPKFDLVIVDEAHYVRNPKTKIHEGVRYFVDNANAAVMMSATPIQLDNIELFVLLNLLRPDVVLDKDTFFDMAEPNRHIHYVVSAARRADDWVPTAREGLAAAGSTKWGAAVLLPNPEFNRVARVLSRDPVPNDERLAFIRDAENLNSFAHLINRTRRRDIGTYFTTRKPETVEVLFTPDQEHLHDLLLDTQARILEAKHGSRSVKFLMSMIRRQASSSLFALAPFIEDILSRNLTALDVLQATAYDEDEDLLLAVSSAELSNLSADIQQLLKFAKEIDTTTDPKRDALLKIIQDKQRLANKKVLMFSSFIHTLTYLQDHLLAAGVRVGLVTGRVSDDERASLRERFSMDGSESQAIDVLLSSEVGCEGLDYQFCDTLVNFDLPWNPQKIEQRIGRIDRYGQQSEVVVIYNIITPGTVDFEIYTRCLLRIGVFREALGGSEEVLGQITREIHDVAENLELTEQERQERLQQISDNQVRVVQEQARLEERAAELFGVVVPQQQIEQEVRDATSAWLSPSALQNLIQRYLTRLVGGEEHIIGNQPVKTLRLSSEARTKLLDAYRALGRKSSSTLYRDWERWLKEGDQRLEITFDAQAASNNRKLVFITPIHPLAQQAAHGFLRQDDAIDAAPDGGIVRSVFYAVSETVNPGQYPFAIYQWQRRGFRDDAQLQPICADPSVAERFLDLVVSATDNPPDGQARDTDDDAAIADEALETAHYEIWRQAREEYRELTRQTAAFRRRSLNASHSARLATLGDQLAKADNPLIKKMRQSQINTAEADFKRRLAEIEEAQNRAEIISTQVARGVLIALPPKTPAH